MTKHDKMVRNYEENGWNFSESFPAAKTTVLVKNGCAITIKGTNVLSGVRIPKN